MRSSLQRWKTAAMRPAVVVVIVVQSLGLQAAWTQEPAQPRIEKEIEKQEKIYHSRGADVPSGYITGRALSEYAELLPAGFCDALGSLGGSDHWLDVGAGAGEAILDYYAAAGDDALPAGKCTRLAGRASAVALSIEDRRTDKWRRQATLLDGRMQYLAGRRLRQYSPAELGKFQIITDVYGGFSYTDTLSEFVERVLSLLEVGGVFYSMVQVAHLEDGTEKSSTSRLTELVDRAGHDVKVCSWLKQIGCAQVSCESRTDWSAPIELVRMRKLCSDVSVPRVKLVKFEAGNPPGRLFQLEP
jgi:hypothetical protein